MKRLFRFLAILGGSSVAATGLMIAMLPATISAIAAERSVTLAVDHLKGNCPSCAYIVRQALSQVEGVAGVEVSMREGTATVMFDDERTDLDALSAATAVVGFPSQPVE